MRNLEHVARSEMNRCPHGFVFRESSLECPKCWAESLQVAAKIMADEEEFIKADRERQLASESWRRKMENEVAEKRRRQERRNEVSKDYAEGGASGLGITGGLIGGLSGCVSCLNKGDFNLLTGALAGAVAGMVIGALIGALIGQLKS